MRKIEIVGREITIEGEKGVVSWTEEAAYDLKRFETLDIKTEILNHLIIELDRQFNLTDEEKAAASLIIENNLDN